MMTDGPLLRSRIDRARTEAKRIRSRASILEGETKCLKAWVRWPAKLSLFFARMKISACEARERDARNRLRAMVI